MSGERRETCHPPGSGSSAAAAFVDPRWGTAGRTGPRGGPRCAGREEGELGRARRESHPSPSLPSGEKTFSGTPETLSWARRGELRVCATRGDSAPGPQGGEWGGPREGLELSAQRPHRIENAVAVDSGHRLAGHRWGGGGGELGESVIFGGNRMGTPVWLRILRSHAAGGRRGRDWQPRSWGGGKRCPASAA